MSPHLVLPIALITSVRPVGSDRLISVTSLSESKPVASLKNPAASAPPIERVNQIGTCASLSLAGIPVVPFSRYRLADGGPFAPAELREAEDDELGGLDGRDADLADHLARLDHFGWVRLRVALDVERLRGGGTEQRAVIPDARQEVRRRDPKLDPQLLVVGLEHAPLRPLHDRLRDEV